MKLQKLVVKQPIAKPQLCICWHAIFLARHFYLIEESVNHVPQLYMEYHLKRVKEISEDPKRIVYDEFHRTSRAQAVRGSRVLVDMREGRKWNVHVALISQSLDDFDPTMIEFATSNFYYGLLALSKL